MIRAGLWLLCLAASAVNAQAEEKKFVTRPSSDCAEGSPLMILHSGQKIPAQGRKEKATIDRCSRLCRENEGGKCAGFNYADGECEIFSSFDSAEMREEKGAVAYQKICVASPRICGAPFAFEMRQQKILVGFARFVEGNVASLEKCLQLCLNAVDEKDFECQSLMYYPADEECILNSEDGRDRPELLAPEKSDLVVYLDNNCAGAQCYAPGLTQYVKVEGRAMAAKPDRIVADISASDCADLCTRRLSTEPADFACKSFVYDAKKRECGLSDERSLPLGREPLVESPKQDHYEKICFNSPSTCRSLPAYTRVPQMILVGFAEYVLENIDSVAKCLDACVSPPDETDKAFVCKSVMYYYKEQECILNKENRASQPELFIPEGEGFQVDYFDIGCPIPASGDAPAPPEPCPKGSRATTIMSRHKTIMPASNQTVIERSSASPIACLHTCVRMAPEKCRGFNVKDGKCTFLTVSSESGALEEDPTGEAYELLCLEGLSRSCASQQPAAFRRKEMRKRSGSPSAGKLSMASLHFCLSQCLKTSCQGLNYNVKSGACEWFAIDGTPSEDDPATDADEMWDYYHSNCASIRLPVEEEDKEETVVSKPKQIPPKPTIAPGPPGVHTICDFNGMKVQITKDEPFTGAFFVKNKYEGCKVEVKDSRTALLDLGFPSGLQQIGGPLPPGVAPDAKGFFPQVRKVRQADNVVPAPTLDSRHAHPGLTPGHGPSIIRQGVVETYKTAKAAPKDIPLSLVRDSEAPDNVPPPPTIPSRPDCGVTDMHNGTYSATVVVQSNNFGIPGLVTSMDQIYTVSCDYSNMMGEGAKAEATLSIDGPSVTDIRPQGKIELSSPVVMQMLSAGGPEDEQTPMIRAEIGDLLELRWSMMAFDDSLDFFVRECTAEEGGPLSPGEQTSLKILERGCPTAAVAGRLLPEGVKTPSAHTKTLHMQAFRFDGSRTVRVVCQLDICSGKCVPAECDIEGKKELSSGRKKREVLGSITTSATSGQTDGFLETGRYKVPKHSQAMASLIIVDRAEEARQEASFRAHRASLEAAQPPLLSQPLSPADADSSVCLPRPTFLGVFLFLALLCLAQAIVVAIYASRRLNNAL